MYNATLNQHIIRFLTRHVYIGAKIVIVWYSTNQNPCSPDMNLANQSAIGEVCFEARNSTAKAIAKNS